MDRGLRRRHYSRCGDDTETEEANRRDIDHQEANRRQAGDQGGIGLTAGLVTVLSTAVEYTWTGRCVGSARPRPIHTPGPMHRVYPFPPCWETKIDTPCPLLMPCSSCKTLKPVTSFYAYRQKGHRINSGRLDLYGRKRHSCCKECGIAYYIKRSPKDKLFQAAKGRAKRFGIDFSIATDDFEIPSVCPVLGIPLFQDVGGGSAGGSNNWNAPTLDRIDNCKGYIKGNICVISRKANTLKGNGTPEELAAVAAYALLALSSEGLEKLAKRPLIDKFRLLG